MPLVRLYGGPADQHVVDVHEDLTTFSVSPRPKVVAFLADRHSGEFLAHPPIYRYRRDTNNPDYAEYLQDFDR
jgi:hypothetical protein